MKGLALCQVPTGHSVCTFLLISKETLIGAITDFVSEETHLQVKQVTQTLV